MIEENESCGISIESAKASQEKWKAAQKLLDLTQDAGKFLKVVFGPASENIGGILSDQTRHWRASNIDRLANYWKQRVKERGIDEAALQHLPFGDAFRVIDAASMEDDDNVQQMWADLLANATDPSEAIQIKKVYIDLLKSLSGAEVIFLNFLWTAESKKQFKSREEINTFNSEMNAIADEKWRKINGNDRNTAIQNLVRLRCISFRPVPPNTRGIFDVPRQVTNPWPRDCALVNVKEFQKLMVYLEDLILAASGLQEFKQIDKIPLMNSMGNHMFNGWEIKVPEMTYTLTSMSRDLLKACNTNKEAD